MRGPNRLAASGHLWQMTAKDTSNRLTFCPLEIATACKRLAMRFVSHRSLGATPRACTAGGS